MQLSLTLLGATLFLTQGILATDCVSVALANIPPCAQPCYLQGAPTIGCDGLDFACQCARQPAMFSAIEGCVAAHCPASEFEKVIDGSNVVCACAAPAAHGGSITVSGTLVPPLATVSSIPIVSSIPVVIAPSPTSGGDGKDEGVDATKTAPTQYSTALSVSGAERFAGVGFPFAFTVGVILAATL